VTGDVGGVAGKGKRVTVITFRLSLIVTPALRRGDGWVRDEAAETSPACASAASTALRDASHGQVIGRRRPCGKPGRTRVIAYFTGPGDASVNSASWSGYSRSCNASAAA